MIYCKCDRCNNDFQKDEGTMVLVYGINFTKKYDLCPDCSKDNDNFLSQYSFDSQSEKEDDSCEETERSNPLGDYCANFTRAIVRHRTILERFFREQFSSSGRSKASDSDSKSAEWTGSSNKEVDN